MRCLSKTQHDVAYVPGRVKRASLQAVLKGIASGPVYRALGVLEARVWMLTASRCVCRKHNMTDRDEVSVENTTWSIEMRCLSKTQHDVAYVPGRVKGRRFRPC
jgi:hypothetical protein